MAEPYDCTPPTDLGNSIAENAAGPASASGDTGSMSQHSLPDQIAADKYLAGKAGLKKRRLGLRHVKLVPPGAVDLGGRGGCW